MAYRKFGQVLVDLGFLTESQLCALLDAQKHRAGERLGSIAREVGLLNDDQLVQALAEQFGLRVISLSETAIAKDVLDHVSETMANAYGIVPVAFVDGILTIASAEPQNLQVVDELRNFLCHDVRVAVASEPEIRQALDRYYSGAESFRDILDEASTLANPGRESTRAIEIAEGPELHNSAPVRRLLNTILLLAVRDKASDLHFEPFENEFKIRVKADGVLFELDSPPAYLGSAITTRIKVMANLDISERRMPQDGRIELTVGGHPVDLRVAVCPTLFGESIVIRILDRSVVNLDLGAVGMPPAMLETFRKAIRKPNGIVLVCGPTGSGKTTTLYSAMSELNDIRDKLITVEDPVEYHLDGVIQTPVDASIDVSFANALRAILRQDPDRILVGEIRDYETAEIAMQASLTGHTVYSTLHTNDASSTVIRLRDMGVATFLITATVEAILAQRLVRRICPHCREVVAPMAEMMADMNLTDADFRGKTFYHGRGCDQCNHSGYKGRVGLFELMVLNDDMRSLILRDCSADELRQTARKSGMVSLRESGMQYVYEGITTVDEVIRETVLD